MTRQCDRFASQLAEIYVNFNRSPLMIYKRTPMTLWQSFMVDFHFCLVLINLFPGCADFHNCPKGNVSHLCWMHSALMGCCNQITILNQCGNHTNEYPSCNYWNHCLVLWSWAFSQKTVENNWSVTRWHVKNPTPWSWYQQSYPGYTWTSEDDYMKRRPCPSLYHEGEQVFLSVHGGVDQAN